jgi:radical SAM superfamily enzyme YgiQ (UPF0313 family)
MAVEVLLFTGFSSYVNTNQGDTTDPIYDVCSRASGTYRIATHLRENRHLDVEVVDFVFSFTYEELVAIVDSRVDESTRMVGIGGIFWLASPNVKRLFKYIKDTYPDIITVAGSQDIWSISQIGVDWCVTGYGELGISSILDGNPKYKDWQIMPGAPVVKVLDCIHTKELQAYPMMDLSIDYEERDFIQSFETLNMETSRGCRFACSYCNFPILGVKDDHTRSAENFELDLRRNYKKWGTTEYTITDDTFNDYIEKIRKYADVVESLDFEPNFSGYIRADLMTQRPDDIKELVRMRFNSHLYGIESTNQESAKAMGKGGNTEKILNGILEAKQIFLKENGFYAGEMSFIWGLPYETPETQQKTFDWIDENWHAEAVQQFPLMIPKNGGLARPNKMTANIQKYGYREMQPVEIAPVGDRVDHILADPNIDPYFKDRLRQTIPDVNSHEFILGVVLWKNEHWDYIDAWVGVWTNLLGHKRYWDRGIPVYWQANWLSCGYSKEDMMKSFRELGEMMHPPRHKQVEFLESYKAKKLAWKS